MNLWDLSWQGGVLIGVILLLRVWGRYRLPGWTFRVLWGVALYVYLFPHLSPHPWSVYNRLIPLADSKPAPLCPSTVRRVSSLSSFQCRSPPAPGKPACRRGGCTAWGTEIPWLTILYLSGVLALAAVFLLTYLRCIRAFRAALPLDTPGLEQIRAQFPELRTVSIRQCDHIRSPLTYGLLRPVILLPRELDLSQEPEITYILLHEGSHVQNVTRGGSCFSPPPCAFTGSTPWCGLCTGVPIGIWSAAVTSTSSAGAVWRPGPPTPSPC